MKKPIIFILSFIAGMFVFSFLGWAFVQHGTLGLYHVDGSFRPLFLIAGFYGLALFLLGLLHQRLRPLGQRRAWRWLSILIIILAFPALITPPLAFSYTSGFFSGDIGNTPPQLMLADSSGIYGIPDMAVTFNTSVTSRNDITWGQAGSMVTLTEDKASKRHTFMLKNLKPGSQYSYQINHEAPVFFATPSSAGPLHFAVTSDAHFGATASRHDLTAKMLAHIADTGNNFSMFFSLGDLVEYGFQNNQWQQAFQAFSATTSAIPVRYVAGNHDTLFAGFRNFENYCSPEGLVTTAGSRLWCRVDAGRVHFMILDLEWSAESYSAAQAAWLEAQLKSIPAGDWKIVLSHGFYFASGSVVSGWKWYDNPETIERLAPLFEKYKVDLVFSGHNHQLELLRHLGVTYVICGSFGGLPDPERTYASPASLWYMSGQYGFGDVTLNGDQCSIVFRDTDFAILKQFTWVKVP
jgi:acid phosphatase type 7